MTRPLPSIDQWARIRLFAMDVDGVLTDGSLFVSSDGTETKLFSILDGHGLKLLDKAGVVTAWISGRQSGATDARARELAIPHLIQGKTDKLTALRDLADRLQLNAGQCIFMGDDVIDVDAIAWAGIGVSVPGGMPAARAAATYVTVREGGRGAVREVCEHLLAARAPRSS